MSLQTLAPLIVAVAALVLASPAGAQTCGDSVHAGLETGVDCGGPTCGGCDAGEGCAYPGGAPFTVTHGDTTLVTTPFASGTGLADLYDYTSSEHNGGFDKVDTGTLVFHQAPDGTYGVALVLDDNAADPTDGSISLDVTGAEGSSLVIQDETNDIFAFSAASGTLSADYVWNSEKTDGLALEFAADPCVTFTFFDGAGIDGFELVEGDGTRRRVIGDGSSPITICRCSDCADGDANCADLGTCGGGGTCEAASSCTDGVTNGDETDVDCGGADCAACGTGAACIYGDASPYRVTVTNASGSTSFLATPIATNESVADFYGYAASSFGNADLPREGVGAFFMHSAPSGQLSIAMIVDAVGGDGGTTDVAVSGATGGVLAVEDDGNDIDAFDGTAGTMDATFAWADCCTDGFAIEVDEPCITVELSNVTGLENGFQWIQGDQATRVDLGAGTQTVRICECTTPECQNADFNCLDGNCDDAGQCQGPDAVDDGRDVDEDGQLDIDVLGNDVGAGLTLTMITPPAHGTISRQEDGTLRYIPADDYNGPDSFTYTVCGPSGACDTATVTISVAAVNDPPTPQGDQTGTPFETAKVLDVLDNDRDVDGDTLTLGVVSDPDGGSVEVNDDGTITYTPDDGFSGPDTFTYEACDAEDVCVVAEVTVTVAERPNEGPDAMDDRLTVSDSGRTTLDVLGNDTDPESDALTVISVTQPSNGMVSVDGAGVVTYTATGNFEGETTFTYTVRDAFGNEDTATVTVVVTASPPGDRDMDGLDDDLEALLGTDPDDSDTDGDGITDRDELAAGDPAAYEPGVDTNPLDADTDDDGLSDGDEVNGTGPLADFSPTDPLNPDSDEDDILDGTEVGVIVGDGPNSAPDGGMSDGPTPVSFEGTADTFAGDADPETKTNPQDDDTDDDALLDGEEDANQDGATVNGIGGSDSVGTGETDPGNHDTDGDGVDDGREVDFHMSNPVDTDSDNGGIDDGTEDINGGDLLDPSDDVAALDGDMDGLSDAVEMALGTAPDDADTDNDGITDGDEIASGDPGAYDAGSDTDPLDADTDDDGLSDGEEIAGTGPLDGFGPTNPLLADTDEDGLLDGLEAGVSQPLITGMSDGAVPVAFKGTDPAAAGWRPDADPTSMTDPSDDDSDGDDLIDGDEDADKNGRVDNTLGDTGTAGTGESDPDDEDTDGDTLLDGAEVNVHGSSPVDPDTDDGGVDDGTEIGLSTNPLDPLDDVADGDRDKDGLLDSVEAQLGTDPDDADTDGDGLQDGDEVLSGDPTRYEAGLDTDPLDADTDDDWISDGDEAAGTGVLSEFGPTNPLLVDTDGDGLADGVEVGVKERVPAGVSDGDGTPYKGTDGDASTPAPDGGFITDPTVADTDGDGASDGEEVLSLGSDPTNPLSPNAEFIVTGNGCAAAGGGPGWVVLMALLMLLLLRGVGARQMRVSERHDH